jgi:hypothetical protein
MKPSALRIERMLEKIEAKLVPPERKWLRAIIHEGDAEAVVKEKQEKALAEHVARHPEDVGLTVKDFNRIMRVIVRSWQDNQQLELVAGTALERDGPTAEPIKTSGD